MEKIQVAEHASDHRCPYCHADVKGAAWECPGCGTVHHEDCARENGSCTVLGCRRSFAKPGVVAPAPRGRQLPPVGAPRTDFLVGLGLTAFGAILGAATIAFGLDAVGPFIGLGMFAIPAGVLTIGYALRRARREGRWSR
ncbi:MAG: hypothetical protein ACAI25_20740 [Planctomycetota bacterium]